MRAVIVYLITQFSPYIWLHPQEKYYPMNIETYINRSQLWCNQTLVSDYQELNTYNLYPISQQYGVSSDQISERCYLQPNPNLQTGFRGNVSRAPVYAYYQEFKDFFEIQYLFFYGYNGAYNILHFFNYLDVNYGEHDGDIEHVTFRFRKRGGEGAWNTTNAGLEKHVGNGLGGKVIGGGILPNQTLSQLEGVYFGAHTSKEGVWIKPEDLVWEGNHLVAFSALDGHGVYPYPGTYYRIFGFANDYCNRGTLWKPSEIDVINDRLDTWYQYQGRYTVKNQIKNILSKTVGNPSAETNHSTDPMARLFYLWW